MQTKNIYKTQPYRLILDTKTDLSSAVHYKITYIKPSGVIGFFNAIMDVVDNTLLYTDVTGEQNDECGVWAVRAHVQFDAGENYTPGTQAEITIKEYSLFPIINLVLSDRCTVNSAVSSTIS